MTYAAFGIHKTLIEEEGIDPNTEEYYTELDNRIKTEFPHKFGETKKILRSPESPLLEPPPLRRHHKRDAEQSN